VACLLRELLRALVDVLLGLDVFLVLAMILPP
jgi:hypothetical protein